MDINGFYIIDFVIFVNCCSCVVVVNIWYDFSCLSEMFCFIIVSGIGMYDDCNDLVIIVKFNGFSEGIFSFSGSFSF